MPIAVAASGRDAQSGCGAFGWVATVWGSGVSVSCATRAELAVIGNPYDSGGDRHRCVLRLGRTLLRSPSQRNSLAAVTAPSDSRQRVRAFSGPRE
jgi:hypothetical protein